MVTFDEIAAGYEAWYESDEGRRADALERALLEKLLCWLPGVRTALEIGCGTGHFTRWLKERGLTTLGLDLSPAMLAQARKCDGVPYLQGDGMALPFAKSAFDVVALITTLEFVADPARVLQEAARVARRGILLGVLNRHSLLAWRRRRAARRRPTIYDAARFYSVGELEQLARKALGSRLRRICWRTTLLPVLSADAPLPWGAFIGMLLELDKGHG